MSTVRKSIELAVPAVVAYEELCHLENYPQFMSGFTQAEPISSTTAHLVLDLDGTRAEFDAQITDQRPGELITWESLDGPQVSETMRLQRLSDSRTMLIAQLEVDAAGFMPSEEYAQEVLGRRLKADLAGFKQYVEHDLAGYAHPAQDGRADPARPTVPTPQYLAALSAARRQARVGTQPDAGRLPAGNERPVRGVPPTGNLGPLRSTLAPEVGPASARRAWRAGSPPRRLPPTDASGSESGDSF